MSIDEQTVALPKLYGAPAYARPPAPVAATPRPFDPDQLPLEVYRTDDERQSSVEHDGSDSGRPGARTLSLPAIARRLLGGD